MASDLLAQMRSNRLSPGLPVVSQESAQRLSAVWAASELVASTASSLPIDQTGEAARLFVDPSSTVHLQGWLHQLFMSAVLRGNAYALVVSFDRLGYPERAETVAPDLVRWRWTADGWEVKVDNRVELLWPIGRLLHVPLFLQPGCPVGLSPIEYHRATLGGSMAAQKFGADFFGSGGHPVGLLMMDQDPGEAGAKAAKARFKQAAIDRDVVALSSGKYVPLTVSPSDSQFLDTMRFGVEEIARVFLGGFPEMIGAATSGQSVTYANREQRVADFLAFSLQSRYLVPFERAFSRWTRNGGVKFNVDALLRSDLAGRYASYVSAATVGEKSGTPLLTTNEMRAFEDLPPLPGGDVFAPIRPANPREST